MAKRSPTQDTDADAAADTDTDTDTDTGTDAGTDAIEPPAPARSYEQWINGAPLPRWIHVVLGLLLPMLVVLWNAWRVRGFTIDDAYISFRYADNLAQGNGLVYNVGERVEGYTNFLWTVILAGASRLGAPIEPTAKVLGALAACASLVPVFLLSRRLRPHTALPTVAPWLLASSFLFTGYAVFGMEAPLFIALTLTGTEMFFREEERASGIPWSGLVFALAALTRPEAPLFFGLLVIWSETEIFERRSLHRIALFAAPVAAHILFRRVYYEAWLPTTLSAKTGDISAQIQGGTDYITRYLAHASPILWLALGSIGVAIVRRRREGLTIASITLLFGFYVLLVGGDWMPGYRFLAPAEPFLFLLVDDALRTIVERRERAATIGIVLLAIIAGAIRVSALSTAQRDILQKDKTFWDDAAGRATAWFLKNGQPGPIAAADIGYIGYHTRYPIVDVLGLVTPEISRLPGGYRQKVGPGFTDAVFGRDPRYVLLISGQKDCKGPNQPFARAIYGDPRFGRLYRLRQSLLLGGSIAWCIYEKQGDSGPP